MPIGAKNIRTYDELYQVKILYPITKKTRKIKIY